MNYDRVEGDEGWEAGAPLSCSMFCTMWILAALKLVVDVSVRQKRAGEWHDIVLMRDDIRKSYERALHTSCLWPLALRRACRVSRVSS